MKILLVDADSKIPNLALMKLSRFHKSQGDSVQLIKLDIPYYPHRKKVMHTLPEGYDKVYCSVVFEGSKLWIQDEGAEFGGTGYSLGIKLPDGIESLEPDYSIYPDNDISYGFISRGCIRNCYFCKVPEKEGYIHQVSTVNKIVRHKKVKFLDNNILALPNHKIILRQLALLKIKCCFNQALDIRLLDAENSKTLSELKYIGGYTFAFDSWSYLKSIKSKLPLLDWCRPWGVKFFVYCNPSMDDSDIVNRIEFLRSNKMLPYIMRDISCWGSDISCFYVDLAAWCNQPNLFKKMSFATFMGKRHTDNSRIDDHINRYYSELEL